MREMRGVFGREQVIALGASTAPATDTVVIEIQPLLGQYGNSGAPRLPR
jgi:hypothetical protein